MSPKGVGTRPATSVGVPGRRLVNLRTGGKTGKVRKTTNRTVAREMAATE